jgi:hypothetical protein
MKSPFVAFRAWSRQRDSNSQSAPYQGTALPLNHGGEFEPETGVEPVAWCLRSTCSATELLGQLKWSRRRAQDGSPLTTNQWLSAERQRCRRGPAERPLAGPRRAVVLSSRGPLHAGKRSAHGRIAHNRAIDADDGHPEGVVQACGGVSHGGECGSCQEPTSNGFTSWLPRSQGRGGAFSRAARAWGYPRRICAHSCSPRWRSSRAQRPARRSNSCATLSTTAARRSHASSCRESVQLSMRRSCAGLGSKPRDPSTRSNARCRPSCWPTR